MKRLYGPRTSSHGGKYVYRRKGLLDEIPHVRLIWGVVIVRTEDAERVQQQLKAYGAEIHERRILLTREDLASLEYGPAPRAFPRLPRGDTSRENR